MGKRKRPPASVAGVGARVEIIVEDLSPHPLCPHGPTLLFSGERGQFYACASCRAGECPVRVAREDWADPRVRENNKKFEKLTPRLDKEKSWAYYQKLLPEGISYCIQCDQLYSSQHKAQHSQHRSVSQDRLGGPSGWLPPLQSDSREAQYFFSVDAVATILNAVRKNDIKNILCVGTPTIHEAAQRCGGISSVLLDLDSRHHRFWPPDKFLWYNMFNHHFFNGEDDERIFDKFLKSSSKSGICIILDPPFGGRVEPIAHSLRTISVRYRELTGAPGDLLPVLWAFPYFSEAYIANLLPDVLMHDYQVNYTNHSKFKSDKPNKPGSPVRLFTNLPHNTIDLSLNDNYKHCSACDKWVSSTNRHCGKCGGCTSKNGTTYQHCDVCGRCVKSTFFHCVECKRCCQEKDHVCGITLRIQSCYNCKRKGHKQSECPALRTGEKQNNGKRKKTRKQQKL